MLIGTFAFIYMSLWIVYLFTIASIFADKEERRKLFEKLKYDIETIIKDFLNSIGSDKLYMDTPPELEGLSNRK